MKKFVGIIVLNFLLIINISEAKILDVGNGIAIDFPKNYKYFEINYKKLNDLLVTFPAFKIIENKDFKENLKFVGIGNNSKLTILVENQKALKLVKKLSTSKGINEIIKEYEDLTTGPLNEFLEEAFTPDLEKKLQEMSSEKKQEEFIKKWFEEPAQVKILEQIAGDAIMSILAKYKFHKYLIVMTMDKKIENDVYNNLQTIGTSQCTFNFKCKNKKDLQQFLKKELPNWMKQSPLYKGTNYSFKFNKTEIDKNSNNNLFLYAQFDMKDQADFNTSSEFFVSTKNEKIIFAGSTCFKNCDNFTKIVHEIFEPTGMLKKN